MKRSLLICAVILIAAALLGWREERQISRGKEANERLLRQISYNASIDPQSPFNMERSKADRARQEKVKNLTRDFFALYRMAPDNPAAAFSEERLRLEAELKRALRQICLSD